MPCGDDLESHVTTKNRGIGSGSGSRDGGTNVNHGGLPPALAAARMPLEYAIDENAEAQRMSWLVPMIVVTNVVVFIVVMYVNNCPKRNISLLNGDCFPWFFGRFSFQPFRSNPLFGPSLLTLEKFGGLEWSKVVQEHQGWRLVTSMWLHAGVIHLLANMGSLVFIGVRLEQQFGVVRIGIIYLLSGFGGSVLSILFLGNSIAVGASGALFGLLGSMLSELITNWTLYTNKVAALLTLLVVVVINLAVGFLPHVDNFAHIGGFLTGFLIGFVLLARPQLGCMASRHMPPPGTRLKSKYKPYQYILCLISLILLIVMFAVALAMLFKGENGNDHCHWCRYLSCIPTSKWNCDENV